MAGALLHAEGHGLSVGSDVVIDVGAHNYPTGIWRGRLTELGSGRACRAVITDPRAKESERGSRFFGREPDTNYTVLNAAQAVDELFRRRTEDATEMESLRAKIKTMREMYESLFVALATATGAKEVKERIDHLIEQLKKR